MSWRREWLTIPVFLPGEFHGQRSLVGYSLSSACPLQYPWSGATACSCLFPFQFTSYFTGRIILLKCNFDHVSTLKSLLSRKDFYLHFVPRAVHTCVTMNNTELYSFFTDIFIQQTTIQWQLCASIMLCLCLSLFIMCYLDYLFYTFYPPF